MKHRVSYGFADYPTNTVLSGNGVDLGDLVQGDLFRADAAVTGSISYETTMGGTLTRPSSRSRKSLSSAPRGRRVSA